MERGMGKTTFMKKLEKKSGEKSPLKDFSTRSFYLNNIYGYKPNQFISQLSDIFKCNSDGKLIIGGNTPIIKIGASDLNIQLTEFLNFYHIEYKRFYKTEKLLLIIDGLDEIPYSSNTSIYDFLPNPALLNNGIYILLTSRTNDELDELVVKQLNTIDVTAQLFLNTNDNLNIKFLQKYLRDHNFSEELSDLLVNKSDGRILFLNPLCRLLTINKLLITDLPEGVDLFSSYLRVISDLYDEKYYEEFISILLVIATSFEPLTIEEIFSILYDSEPTYKVIAYIYDIKGFLNIHRNSRGTVYSIAHEEFRIYLKKEYHSNISIIIKDWTIKCLSLNYNTHLSGIGSLYLISFVLQYLHKYDDSTLNSLLNENYFCKIKLITKQLIIDENSDVFIKSCKIAIINQILDIAEKINNYQDYLDCIKGTDALLLPDVVKTRTDKEDAFLQNVVLNIETDFNISDYLFYRELAIELYRNQKYEMAIYILRYLYKKCAVFDDMINLILIYKSSDILIEGRAGMPIAQEMIENELNTGITNQITDIEKAFLFFSAGRIFGDTIQKLLEAKWYFESSISLFISNNEIINSKIANHSLALHLFDVGELQKSYEILYKLYNELDDDAFKSKKYISDAFLLNYKIISFIYLGADNVFMDENSIYSNEILQYYYSNMCLISIVKSDNHTAQKYYELCLSSINNKGGLYSKAAILNNYFYYSKNKSDLDTSRNICISTHYSLGEILTSLNSGLDVDSGDYKGYVIHNGHYLWPCVKNIDLIKK